MFSRLIAFVIPVLVALTVLAAPSFAAGTSQEGYTIPGGTIQVDLQESGKTPASTTPKDQGSEPLVSQTTRSAKANQLPFTGLDVALLLGAGVLLLGTGVALSRLTRLRHATD